MLFLRDLSVCFVSCRKSVKCMGMPIILASHNRCPISTKQYVVNVSFNGCGIQSMSVAGHHDEKLFRRHVILPVNSAGYTPSLVACSWTFLPLSPKESLKPEKHSDKSENQTLNKYSSSIFLLEKFALPCQHCFFLLFF